jgi:hypothetical protein
MYIIISVNGDVCRRLQDIHLGDGSTPSTEKVTEKCEIIQSENSRFSMLCAHYREHAPSFIQQVPAKIHEECQGWGYGPLEMCPCDHGGAVQVLVW